MMADAARELTLSPHAEPHDTDVGRGPLLEARAVSKSYGGVTVLHSVDLALRGGEVHALLGENGAGKSTLVRILSGIIQASDGHLLIGGVETAFATVRDAQMAGISIIHQELNLVPQMTVAENIFLGREPRLAGLVIDRPALARGGPAPHVGRGGGGATAWLGVRLDPSSRVGSLRIGEQQLVEIAKALSLDASVLIMDEPTSALSPPECAQLFKIIRQLAEAGVAIVYISHRMDEVELLADRVTVLRDGRRVASGTLAQFSPVDLIMHMVGRDVVPGPPKRRDARRSVALSVRGLGLRVRSARGVERDAIRGVSFEVHAGEVLGIGGLLGSGRTEILETIFGSAQGARGGGSLDQTGATRSGTAWHSSPKIARRPGCCSA